MGEIARALPGDYDYEEAIRAQGYRKQLPVISGESASFSLELPEKILVPKFTFRSDEIRLRALKPVTIFISKGEELWLADNENLNIYATGKDSVEAIKDFTEQLIHFYLRHKSSSEENLLEYARRLRKIFLENFVEEF